MSQFFDQASLVMVPSGYKNGKVYSQKPLSADGELTFTRASTATRVNASGLIEEVASGVPRLDYSGGATCPSLLLEPQRTNSALFSEQFDTADWTKGAGTITANNAVAPDGYQNADLFTADGTNTQHFILASQTTGAKTISFFVKMGTQRYVQILSSGTVNTLANYDLQTGAVGGLGSTSTASMVDYGNGWWRIILTSTDAATGNIYLCFADSLTAVRYPSIASSGTIWIWGGMVELNATHATSYISTQGSAVTRLADAAYKTGISSLIGSEAGTIYLEASALADDLSERRIALTDGSTSNVVRVGFTNVSNRIIAVLYNGTNQCVLTYSDADITQTNKIAFTWSANDFALFVNGVKRSSDVFGTTFAANTLTRLGFDRGAGAGDEAYGNFDQVLLFKSRLSDSDLATLTA